MLKKLTNFLRSLKKWWKEIKFIEMYEERYVLMKYSLGVAKYKEIDGTTQNYIAQKQDNGFILFGKSNMYQVIYNWRKCGEKEGVTEWMPIHEVTTKINEQYKKEMISNLHEGLEEHEYQIVMKELQTIL